MVESAASSSRRRRLHWTLSVLRSAGVRRGAAAALAAAAAFCALCERTAAIWLLRMRPETCCAAHCVKSETR